MIKKQTIEDFLKDVGGVKPTPGGGAVAAVTASLSAALVEMVCNLTIGRKSYPEVQGRVKEISTRMQEVRIELLDLADADSEAFQKVMESYKSEDKSKIKAALYWAIEIPQKVSTLAKEIGEMAMEVSKIGNKNAHSDAMSAEYLANAAFESAEENIEINKKSLAALG
ncbi:MAG: cyclodeaminase/cyclohydrolase family protein [Candidatus Microgenomates bacterium]|jgi:formiminotetrahydrofolate cyclodeaminase